MLRVHFTVDDLARTRVGATFGPLTETVFSLDVLARRGPTTLFDGWRERLPRQARQRTGPLRELLPRAWVFDLNMIAGRASCIDEGLDALRSAPRQLLKAELEATARLFARPPAWAAELLDRDGRARELLAAALHQQYADAVAPCWTRAHALLDGARRRLVHTMGEHGVAGLLTALHPTIRWRPPILEIASPAFTDHDCHLEGRGLVVVPSLFCPSGYPVCEDASDETAPVILFYPAIRDLSDVRTILGPGRSSHESLVALLGRTRTNVLQAIADGDCTTSELADRSRASTSSASQHAAILRGAGLVVTRRHGTAVLHTLTPLGSKFLNGDRSEDVGVGRASRSR
jgi:DNA-binding transcriptional ArsR family regulator